MNLRAMIAAHSDSLRSHTSDGTPVIWLHTSCDAEPAQKPTPDRTGPCRYSTHRPSTNADAHTAAVAMQRTTLVCLVLVAASTRQQVLQVAPPTHNCATTMLDLEPCGYERSVPCGDDNSRPRNGTCLPVCLRDGWCTRGRVVRRAG